MRTRSKVDIWWRYFLLFTALIISRPTFHFVNQALRGQPLDINYFWSELSLEKVLAAGLYNGDGGADWNIGKPKATIWNAEQLRSLLEIRKFALELVNRDRDLNYLPTLRQDTILSLVAQRHAEDMLARNYFSHISPEGKRPRDRYLALGGTRGKGVAENILQSNTQGFGLTYGEAERFQRGWMYSNGHRENLLAVQYTKFGYGIATGVDGRIYAVQMFAE
ncbi:CAP domain-containing protein [Calothrix membranacea FACHB-236]|nr:CAP domain-containing protein [Calothrix membranacea FACHB-236]